MERIKNYYRFRKHPHVSLTVGALQTLALVCGILGSYYPSAISMAFDGDTSIGIGLWRAEAKVADVTDAKSYTCEEIGQTIVYLPEGVGLDARAVLTHGLSNWKGEDLSEGDPLTFGSGVAPEVDERFFRGEERKSAESMKGGSWEGYGFHSRLDETKCGIGFKRRCNLGRGFSVISGLSSFVGIGLSIKELDQVGSKTFRKGVSAVGFFSALICMLVIVAYRESSFNLDNALCGTSGEWSYSISFILYCVVLAANIASGIIAHNTEEDRVPQATLARRYSRESLKRLSQQMVKAPVRRPSEMVALNDLSGRRSPHVGPAIIYKPGMTKAWNEGFSH